jgi:hypothetical protein
VRGRISQYIPTSPVNNDVTLMCLHVRYQQTCSSQIYPNTSSETEPFVPYTFPNASPHAHFMQLKANWRMTGTRGRRIIKQRGHMKSIILSHSFSLHHVIHSFSLQLRGIKEHFFARAFFNLFHPFSTKLVLEYVSFLSGNVISVENWV